VVCVCVCVCVCVYVCVCVCGRGVGWVGVWGARVYAHYPTSIGRGDYG
jgi:hypothetical protein